MLVRGCGDSRPLCVILTYRYEGERDVIYIFCAMSQEARPLIRKLALKKQKTRLPYQQYMNETGNIGLTIMGIGPVAAAACVGSVLGEGRLAEKSDNTAQNAYLSGTKDYLVLFGTAAGSAGAEGLYLINKLINADSNRTFYPDLLIETDLPEAEIVTSSKIMSEKAIRQSEQGETRLYDMESAAVYEAASRYLGPHEMSFLKCVSDHGISIKSLASLTHLSKVVDQATDKTVEYLRKVERFLRSDRDDEAREQVILEETKQLDEAFRASEAMHFEIRQLLRYAHLTERENAIYAGKNDEMTNSGMTAENVKNLVREYADHPAKDRREGKRLLYEFRQRLTR